jgi:hypothetical protein
VATDDKGDVYIAGETPGSFGGANQGGGDTWIAKYSEAGILLWNRQLGTPADDRAAGVATDDKGGIYMAGYTAGSLGGPNEGGYDAWIAKYSASGALLWKRQFGTLRYDDAAGVAADKKGGLYVAGSTFGSLGGPNKGGYDAFVAKYSQRR